MRQGVWPRRAPRRGRLSGPGNRGADADVSEEIGTVRGAISTLPYTPAHCHAIGRAIASGRGGAGEAIGTVSPPVGNLQVANDVLLQGSKVAGILLESRASKNDLPPVTGLRGEWRTSARPGTQGDVDALRGVPKSVAGRTAQAFSRHFLSRSAVGWKTTLSLSAGLAACGGTGEILVRLPHEVLEALPGSGSKGYLLQNGRWKAHLSEVFLTGGSMLPVIDNGNTNGVCSLRWRKAAVVALFSNAHRTSDEWV